MNQRAGVPKIGLRVVGTILRIMKTCSRYTAIALAASVLVAAGCGGTGDAEKAAQRAAEEERQAALLSEFERAVDEARYLRDDIAALREDMRAVREAANDEVRRASREASDLRDEIAAIRSEVQQLSEAAASEAARTADESKSLREEISAIRAEVSSLRVTAEKDESLSPNEIAAAEMASYPDPVVIDEEDRSIRGSSLRRTQRPTTVIYAPSYERRRVYMTQPHKSRTGARRQRQSADAGPQMRDSKPSSPGKPSVSSPRPSASSVRPVAPASRRAAPAPRPAAPAPRPAPRPAAVQQKTIHIPVKER